MKTNSKVHKTQKIWENVKNIYLFFRFVIKEEPKGHLCCALICQAKNFLKRMRKSKYLE